MMTNYVNSNKKDNQEIDEIFTLIEKGMIHSCELGINIGFKLAALILSPHMPGGFNDKQIEEAFGCKYSDTWKLDGCDALEMWLKYSKGNDSDELKKYILNMFNSSLNNDKSGNDVEAMRC